MKFFKSTLLIVGLFTVDSLNTKNITTKRTTVQTPTKRAVTKPIAQTKPTSTPKSITQPVIPQSPVTQTQIKSYGQALNAIRTSIPSDKILKNNVLTPEFINFVKSLNLSDIENKSLLQAGTNIHATWAGNNTQDKQISLTLKNNIESALQNFKPKLQPQLAPSQPTPTKTPTPQPIQQPIPQPQLTPSQPTPTKTPTSQPIQQPIPQPQLTPSQPTPTKTPTPQPIQQPIPQPQLTPSQPTQQRQPKTQAQLPKTQQKTTTPTMPIIQSKPVEQIFTQQSPTATPFATNNVIMILDPTKEESMERRVGALVQCAVQALYEKAAPIIMTSNILEIITTVLQKISPNELQQLRNANYTQIPSLATQLLQKYSVERFGNIQLILLSMINFDTNNFNCYFHTSANLVLLIPKQYITTNLPNAASMNMSDQAQACGFNPTIITAINDLTPNNLAQQLQQQPVVLDEEQFVTNLTSLFILQKRNGQLISPEQDTKWLLYVTGHGGPAHQSIGIAREQLKINKSNLAILQSSRAVKNQNNLTAKINAEANVKHYEKMLEGKSDWPNSQLIPESARVAGLKMGSFAQLIKFFDTGIDTAFLHYSTCFAGGYNQSFVNEILSSLNVNFIVSAEGIHEGSVMRQIGVTFSSKKPHVRLENQAFTNFFNLLRLFISDPKQFVKTKQAKKEPVAQILRAIVPNMEEKNQPFVRFPGAGVFGALSLGKNTKILTESIVKAHEIEKRPIDVSNTNINIVVINPSQINVPLNLGKNIHCALVSPTPTTITPGYQAFNVFKEINFESTMQLLIYNFIRLNARLHTQTFVVNKLTGITTKESGLSVTPGATNTVNNLIIQMKGVSGSTNNASNTPALQSTLLTAKELRYGTIGSNIQVTFEFNGDIYQCLLGIKNFEDPNLERTIQQLSFTSQPAATMDMNSVASKFLSPQEVTKLTKPITLKNIAELINSTIDQQNPLFKETETDESNTALLDFLKRKQK